MVKSFEGHEGGVLCVKFDPQGKYLASAGSDGNLKIWNLENAKLEHSVKGAVSKNVLKGFPDSMDPLPYRFEWSKDGNAVVYPTDEGIVVLKRNSSWKQELVLKDESLKVPYQVSMSPDVDYLSCVDLSKQCYIFNSKKQAPPVEILKNENYFTDMQWSSFGNDVLLCDDSGKVYIWSGVIPEDALDDFEEELIDNAMDEEVSDEKTVAVKPMYQYAEPTTSQIEGSLDTMEIPEGLESKPKKRLVKKSGKKVVIDEDSLSEEEDDDDDESNDLKDDLTEKSIDDLKPYETPKNIPHIEHQEPFQPGSTEYVDKRRFMAYNHVGYIVEDRTSNNIEIEFHDVSKYKHDKFTDHFNSTMGALGDYGAIFANKSDGTTLPSSLVYKQFNSWTSNKQLRIKMEFGEEIECVAVGKDFFAAATKTERLQYYIRLYSSSGIQRFIFSMPSQVVTMCGYQNYLVAVYYDSPNSTTLHYKLWDIKKMQCIAKDILPLTYNSKLKWIGFTLSGLVATFDSAGIVRIRCPNFGDEVIFFRTTNISTVASNIGCQ